MKKILLFAIGIVLLSACKKDDADMIVGVWKMDFFTFDNRMNTHNRTYIRIESTWEFLEDGTGFQDGMGVTYTIQQELLSIKKDSGDVKVYDINRLDRERLVISCRSEHGKRITYVFIRM